MDKYIKRRAIIEKLNEIGGCDATDDWGKGWDKAIDTAVKAVEKLPAAGTVEVVRCKDCKWYKVSKLLAPNKFCFRLKDGNGNHVGYNFVPDDFCSHGERKDGGDKKMPDKNIPWSKRAPFDPESITCGRCDSDISDRDFEFCPYCGQKLDWSCLSDTETSFEMDGKTYNVFFGDDDSDDDD